MDLLDQPAQKRCPSCSRRRIERRMGEWECEVMPCHGPKGRAVVLLGSEICPDCGGVLVTDVWRADAMFWMEGKGATVRTERRVCIDCHWAVVSRSEERPAFRPTKVGAA